MSLSSDSDCNSNENGYFLRNYPTDNKNSCFKKFSISSQDIREAGPSKSNENFNVSQTNRIDCSKNPSESRYFLRSSVSSCHNCVEKPSVPIQKHGDASGVKKGITQAKCNQNSSTVKTKKCEFCNKLYKNEKGIKSHIRSAHPEAYRNNILDRANGSNINSTNNDLGNNLRENCKLNPKDYETKLDSWLTVFKEDLSTHEFEIKVHDFVDFLKKIINYLPGPKHPACKYYNLRKHKKDMLVSQNRKFKDSSNPERKTIEDRKRRREKYLYQVIQYEYYNQRRKAVRRIIGADSKGCTLDLDEIYNQFSARFSLPNDKVRPSYFHIPKSDQTELDDQYSNKIEVEEVLNAMKNIAIDTCAGPDGILLRAVKNKKVATILAVIFTKMNETQFIPSCFKIARTILLDKGGNCKNFNNWRPISICSVIRRIFEKILDRRLRTYICFNENQRGFTNTPGTLINTSILNSILQFSKRKNCNCCIFFLDISKAYDNIGIKHLESVLYSKLIPSSLRNTILGLTNGNKTKIETMKGKTKEICFLRGVLQGSPLSPTLYNLCVDHILEELSEPSFSSKLGFQLSKDLPSVSVLGFADDTVLIAKDKDSAILMFYIIKQLFSEIGLNLNLEKTFIINIINGTLVPEKFEFDGNLIQSIDENQKIKYLGVNFNQEIIFDNVLILQKLKDKIEKIVSSPFLKDCQKINVLNTYIWPSLIYSLQTAPLKKLSLDFLNNVDNLIRSATREILDLPHDIPNSMFYSPKKFRGMSLFRAKWEAFLQHFARCDVLQRYNIPIINHFYNLALEKTECIQKLELDHEIANVTSKLTSRSLRDMLREKEFSIWCALPTKGKGVALFKDFTKANAWLHNLDGITSSEFKQLIKMNGGVTALRITPGRSRTGTQCRRCSTSETFQPETLGHVLGSCPFGERLRLSRHHTIRKLIADELRKLEFDVAEEVYGVADSGSSRRIDIIAICKRSKKAYIIDPTIRIESDVNQASLVNLEKQSIYKDTLNYYKTKYDLSSIEIIGLFIGARGTLTQFFVNFCRNFKLDISILKKVWLSCVKYSVCLLNNHLYA